MIVFSFRPLPFNYFSLFSVNLLLELLGLLSLVKKKHLLSQSNWSDSMKVQFTYICIYVYICHGHCSVTWDKDTVREKWLELFFLPVTGWFLTYPCLISHKLRTCFVSAEDESRSLSARRKTQLWTLTFTLLTSFHTPAQYVVFTHKHIVSDDNAGGNYSVQHCIIMKTIE